MADLTKISTNFSSYLTKTSPQIKDDSLQWYLSGSLASMILADAKIITEIELDENNKVVGEKSSKTITEKQREKIKTFSRKLGIDIDVVNVNGNLFIDAPLSNKPNITNVTHNVPDIAELMSWQPGFRGSMYIDNLEGDRNISHHSVAKVETSKGVVYVTTPPELLAHKLSETLFLINELQKDNPSEAIKSKYQKDIHDLSSMFFGFKDLYDSNEFNDRIFLSLMEKQDSYFSINNHALRNANQTQIQLVLESLSKKITSDSIKCLETFADDKSISNFNEFMNALFAKRRAYVNNLINNKSLNNKNNLHQTDTEMSEPEEETR